MSKRTALKLLGFAAGAVLIGITFQRIEISRVLDLISRGSYALLLIPIPYFAALCADALGWTRILKRLGHAVAYPMILSVRLAIEPLLLTLPVGALASDSMRVLLLRTRCAIPVPQGVASIAAARCLIMFSHGIYLLLALSLDFEGIRRSSPRVLGAGGLEWLVLGIAFSLIGAALVTSLCFLEGAIAERAYHLLLRLPVKRLGSWLERRRGAFLQADQEMISVLSSRKLAGPAGAYLVAWLFDSVEAYLILLVLGPKIGLGAVLSMQAILSFVRAVAFLPAGIGIQDAGYALLFSANGVADPLSVAAAFVVLKRAKEVLWIMIGYGFLALGNGPPRPAATAG